MKGSILVSCFCGAFAILPCYFIFRYINMEYPLIMAFSSAAIFACMLLTCLLIQQKLFENNIRKLEERLPPDYIIKFNGNFELGRKDSALDSSLKNCNIYFYETQIIIMCTEKPYKIEYIQADRVKEVVTNSVTSILIITNNKEIYCINTPDCKYVFNKLMALPDLPDYLK